MNYISSSFPQIKDHKLVQVIPDLLSAATVAAVAALLSAPVHVSEGKVSRPRGLACELVTEKGASVVPLVLLCSPTFPVWLVWAVCPGQ